MLNSACYKQWPELLRPFRLGFQSRGNVADDLASIIPWFCAKCLSCHCVPNLFWLGICPGNIQGVANEQWWLCSSSHQSGH